MPSFSCQVAIDSVVGTEVTIEADTKQEAEAKARDFIIAGLCTYADDLIDNAEVSVDPYATTLVEE